MIHIPKLVRETIDFYLNEIYQKKWQENIKIMHQQYKKRIYVFEIFEHSVSWKIKNTRHSFITICLLTPSALNRSGIFSFLDAENQERYMVAPIPNNYYYSSGLNHPHGYRKF